ncbi:MAG: ferrous iron transport protein B, partial [Blastochloris sp.]|nr:ferrous iron transport protein B [Blastochloris sp.]
MLFIDLPGTYSLNALSPDEHITVEALAGRTEIGPRPDLILCVAEAGHLQRSLLPAFQAAPLGLPMVIAANFMDEAKFKGIHLDAQLLEQHLGIPVIPTEAHRGRGIDALREAMRRALDQHLTLKQPDWPQAVRHALDLLQPQIRKPEDSQPCAFTAQRILFDTSDRHLVTLGGNEGLVRQLLEEARSSIVRGGHHPATAEPVLLFAHIHDVLKSCLTQPKTDTEQRSRGLDRILAHPQLGLLAFALIMFAVFQAVYSWSSPLMDAIESGVLAAQNGISPLLSSTPMLQSLVTEGIIAGLGSVLVFLPQILILTALIAFLEDSGYLSRAAFLVDRVFSGVGLSGKSFVPLMSSHACAIPGILATRNIEDLRTRLTTIFIAPLMSCSARLPVYVLMIGAFIEPSYGSSIAALCLLAAHLIGPLVALPIAWLLQQKILRYPSPPFILELPPYRLPTVRDLVWRVGQRASRFLSDAGTLIFCITVIVWALLYFPRPNSVTETVRANFVQEQTLVTGLESNAIEQALADPQDPMNLHTSLDHALSSATLSKVIS